MKHGSVVIVGNGDIDWIKKSDLTKHSYVIGVDRAAWMLLKRGIIPHLAIGDFDSVSQKQLSKIKKVVLDVREYPADKDQTDLELAVSVALERHPLEIVMYGCLGRRLDHEIAAFHILREIQKKQCQTMLRDEYNEIRLVEGGCKIKKKKHFSYLSILPFTDEITVSISGCKYPLHNHVMKKGTTLGVSNIIISDHADITVHKGIAYCILSKDGKSSL